MENANNALLCPVIVWVKIVKRILQYSSTNIDTYNDTFFSGGKLRKITSNSLLKAFCVTATVLTEACLGFKPNEIGTLSICSGAAMAMYSDEVPIYTVMIIGRWSSDAFLKYFRKQVE